MSQLLFLSYSRKDNQFVDHLVAQLQQQGFNVWLDRSSIQSGEQWRKSIVEGINACDWFIIVLSPNSVESENVAKELTLADDQRKRKIPIIIQQCNIPAAMAYQLAGLQHVDFATEPYQNAMTRLVTALQSSHQSVPPQGTPEAPPRQTQSMPAVANTQQFQPTFSPVGTWQVHVSFPFPYTQFMASYGQNIFLPNGQYSGNLMTQQGTIAMQGVWSMAGSQITIQMNYTMSNMPYQTFSQITLLTVTGVNPYGFAAVSGQGQNLVFQRTG